MYSFVDIVQDEMKKTFFIPSRRLQQWPHPVHGGPSPPLLLPTLCHFHSGVKCLPPTFHNPFHFPFTNCTFPIHQLYRLRTDKTGVKLLSFPSLAFSHSAGVRKKGVASKVDSLTSCLRHSRHGIDVV